MIPVITSATESGRVLGYDVGDKKNKDQRIQILDSEGVYMDSEIVERLNLNWTDEVSKKEFKRLSRNLANDLSKQFNAQASLNDRVVKNTGHIALSFPPGDRPRLDEDEGFAIQLAREYMEKMGIDDTQWVLTKHLDTNCPHYHIAYNRVRYDGTVISSKNERFRSQKVAREITKKYGLTPAGKSPRNIEALNKEQHKYAKMRLSAREALARSTNFDEFREELRKRGIEVLISEHSGTNAGYGLTYRMGDITAKGSKLDRAALSYAKVMKILKKHEVMLPPIQLISTIKDTLWQQLGQLQRDTYHMYNEAKKAHLELREGTDAKAKEMASCWEEFVGLNKRCKEEKEPNDMAQACAALLVCFNPLIGITVLLLAWLAKDVDDLKDRKQKRIMLDRINTVRADLIELERKKAALKIEKQELLEKYLLAKNQYKDYKEQMTFIDEKAESIKKYLSTPQKINGPGPKL